MNSRWAIPMLCVGAVAFACGPRPRSDASVSGDKPLTAAHLAVAQQGRPSGNHKAAHDTRAPVSAELYVRATAQSVRLALHVMNTGKKGVELRFPSGQTYDFVIVDSLDREVWRWGKGRMFTQTLHNKPLGAGESLDMDETWDAASLPPGRYVARARLTSENYPLVRQTAFTIAGTTIASR